MPGVIVLLLAILKAALLLTYKPKLILFAVVTARVNLKDDIPQPTSTFEAEGVAGTLSQNAIEKSSPPSVPFSGKRK